MRAAFPSLDAAKEAFARYAELEPRLWALWELCRSACLPSRDEPDEDVDPFEHDAGASGGADDGWCAEDFFFWNVKPDLLLLVGDRRRGPSHELHSRRAYDEVYALLIDYALERPCACCTGDVQDDEGPHHHPDHAGG